MARAMKNLAAQALLFLIGTAFILYGLVMPLLPYAGERAAAEITTVRRELGDRQDPLPNRYSWSVGYEFTLPDGTVVHGNTKVIGSSFSAGTPGPPSRTNLPALPWSTPWSGTRVRTRARPSWWPPERCSASRPSAPWFHLAPAADVLPKGHSLSPPPKRSTRQIRNRSASEACVSL